MPELDGIAATRRLVEADPTVAILVLTMFEDDESVFQAMRAGARGYLLKGADHDELERAAAPRHAEPAAPSPRRDIDIGGYEAIRLRLRGSGAPWPAGP
jgi:CheY-like chemotaxis protein